MKGPQIDPEQDIQAVRMEELEARRKAAYEELARVKDTFKDYDEYDLNNESSYVEATKRCASIDEAISNLRSVNEAEL